MPTHFYTLPEQPVNIGVIILATRSSATTIPGTGTNHPEQFLTLSASLFAGLFQAAISILAAFRAVVPVRPFLVEGNTAYGHDEV
jgi:hypothetical protein